MLPFLISVIAGLMIKFSIQLAVHEEKEKINDYLVTFNKLKSLKNRIVMATDDWDRHSALVLKSLERLEADIATIKTDIEDLKVKTGKLDVKSGLWGVLGGSVVFLVALIINLIK